MYKGKVMIGMSLVILLFLIVPNIKADYMSDDELEIGVTVNDPILKINVIEDYVNLGNLSRGYETTPKPFNVTNQGTINAIIQPRLKAPDEIFSNLYIGTSRTTGYKIIGNFTGNITKGATSDFWIKLDLTDYKGSIKGNLSTNLTFYVMSNG
jgi:hypothetical protein